MLAPGQFLPLADALDLQIRIDERVLRQACRSALSWSPLVPWPVTVAVNVASAHLTAPGFAESVRGALAESGLPAHLLVLEVTETAVVSDLEVARSTLEQLSALGVRISIDDFGTGYSSMLQLRQLPFDKLKIDREFVKGLPHSGDDVAICASVISLANRLGVDAIAEGVETMQQAGVLAGLGCSYGQGFLWSPALPDVDAAALLTAPAWRALPPLTPTTMVRRLLR